jgi:mRNA-degrading endonuclease toxin of MazEF toxin-antitoxin module
MTLDRSKFVGRIGKLTEDRMAAIDAGLAAALDLSPLGG